MRHAIPLGLAVTAGTASLLCCSIARGFTLVDNTNTATAPITSSPGLISINRQAAFTFTTSSDWRPYTQFNLSLPLAAIPPTGVLPDLTLQIYSNPTFNTNPAPGTLIYSKTFLSQVGRYNQYIAPFSSASYNSLWFDTVNPLLSPNATYSFVFSSTSSDLWGLGGSTTGFTNSLVATTPYTRVYSSGSWSDPGLQAGFYLDGVPTPLPILGAGSAFAWSRRLRRRVRQSNPTGKSLKMVADQA